VQLPPGNWFVPSGRNRIGSGGNEAVGAFDGKGRSATPRAWRDNLLRRKLQTMTVLLEVHFGNDFLCAARNPPMLFLSTRTAPVSTKVGTVAKGPVSRACSKDCPGDPCKLFNIANPM
jgi:hypothetical protein